jgi:PAS domain S-box-containing protein
MLMPNPYRDAHDGYLHRYADTGERRIIGVGRVVVGERKDGTTFPMDLSVGEAKEDGESIFVGIIHDLTERKRSEQAIREAAQRLKAVVDTAVDGVILIDARGKVMMFNPACEALFGYGAAEVIGRNVKMLMPAPFRGEHDRYLSNYLTTRVPKIIGIGREVSGRRKDGTTFPMDLSVGEAMQDDGPVFVGIIHDLTERKRTSEQLFQAQKMETVGQLSGGIAHDFNNLLTVIIGNAESLSDVLKARPDLRKLAEAIIAAGERGAELTQRLLAFSRRQTLKPSQIDCNQLVDKMGRLLRRTLREDIDIATTLESELKSAFADPAQLESAVLNLALNAQDAMPSGGRITVSTANASLDEQYRSTHPEVPTGDYIMVAVTDDGDGMPPEVLARAFEPFFTTKEVGKGSGLGLSMVYGFVKQSNGHVAIYSEVGLGTTVRIYLPVARGDDSHEAAPTAAEEPLAPGGQETVLVAEDDAFVRDHAVSIIKGLGYQVIASVDGDDAMRCLASGAPVDLLFTDVVMPGSINGIDLVERAQQLRPGLKVLLTSGYALDNLRARRQLPSGIAVLHKPYRKVELARRIRDTLDTVVETSD